METLDLNVKTRDGRGKKTARSLRRDGRVPAVIYGPKMSPETISLEAREFDRKVGFGSHSQLLKLLFAEGPIGEKLVLVKDIQRHPLTRNLLHADHYEVDVKEKIRVDVALNFVGKAVGVDLGGILQPVRRSVEVLCLPLQIPDEFEIDVTALGIHDAIHMSDLTPPDGVEIPYDVDVALVTVLPPVVEEARAATTDEEAEAAVAPVAGEKAEPEESAED